MRRHLSMALGLLMAVAMLCIGTPMSGQTYWNGTSNKTFSGSGTEADPYLISTPEQLAGLAERTNVDKEDFAGKYLKLTADIYLTDFSNPDTTQWKEWEPIAHSYMQWGSETDYGYFRGHFDGNGHTIYNLYYGKGMNWADDWDAQDLELELSDYDFSVMNKALFVNLDGGTIENLNIANAKMAGVGQALLVLNTSAGSVVRSCHVQGELRGSQGAMSGLVGTNKGLIENCSANITAEPLGCGAFVSTNDSTGVIRNCTTSGSLYCIKGNGAGFASTNNGLIEHCTADVAIRAMGGPDVGTNAVGGHTFRYRSGAGFVMNNGGTIRTCGATGDLMAEGTSVNYVWSSAIAGFAYSNDNGVIESSWCSGTLRDVSDSTASGSTATLIQFVYMNGESAGHSGDGNYAGTCINCFSASNLQTKSDESQWLSNGVHGFLCTYNNGSGFDCEYAPLSRQIGCYFSEDGLPATTSQLGGGWQGQGVSLNYMKSPAFVDSLNLVAQFMGTHLWQYNAGALPTPTTTVAPQSSTVFFAGGDGSKTSPYLVGTKQQLTNISWLVEHGYDFRGEYLKQTADIALNRPFEEWGIEMPTQWTPIGTTARFNSHFSRTYTTPFCGQYDGDWHEVQNMYIDNILLYQGLFGMVGDHVTFRNLGVTGAYIRAASFGILAGQMGYGDCETGGVNIIQCWVSGDAQTQGSNQDASGAFIASKPESGLYLNCSSTATLTGGNGYWSMGALDGSTRDGFATDTLLNFLMTGSINNSYNPRHSIYQQMYMKTPTNHCHYNENAFFDNEVQILSENPPTDGQPTAWLQSKECVNIYNASVTEWNAAHGEDLQINYWEWRENGYPQVSSDANYKPSIVITFNSNGGSSIVPKYLIEDSKAIAPARPTKEGNLFAGWYTDSELTQFFDWENTAVSESMTLYAKWITDSREDFDFTPFNNKFTSTYHIKTAAQLRAFAALQNGLYDYTGTDCSYYGNVVPTQTRAVTDFTGKTIVLDNDIFLNDTADWQYWGHNGYAVPWKPIGQYTYSVPGGDGQDAVEFKGTFDGQGHVIYGMYIEMQAVPSADNYYGLFGALAEGAVVKNVGLEASVIDGIKHEDLIIDGVRHKDITLAPECATTADLLVAGLLVGTATNATIEQCYAVGKIIILNNFNSSSCAVGGLVGSLNTWGNVYGTMTNCYARVDIEVMKADDKTSFGLIGRFDHRVNITNCYAASKSYAGLMPYSSEYMGTTYYANNALVSSYFDSELVRNTTGAGTPKSTTDMHIKATYVDWDFENIWGRKDTINSGYPYLRIFKPGIPDDADPLVPTDIEFEESEEHNTSATGIHIMEGDTIRLHARVLPHETIYQNIIWSSSNPKVATVDSTGLVTGVMGDVSTYGNSTIITATTEWGSFSKQCYIKVHRLSSISIEAPESSVNVGETLQLSVSTNPVLDFYTPKVIWTSPDESIMTISEDGLLTGVSVGSGYVTAQVQVGSTTKTAQKYISVNAVLPSSVTIDDYSGQTVELREGETLQLSAVVLPSNSTYKTVTWESNYTTAATVDENGLVTAVKGSTYGSTATIYARVYYSSSQYDYVEDYMRVKVYPVPAEEVIINPQELIMYPNETYQLEATVLPENAGNKTVYWTSANTSIATVDNYTNKGLVTAKTIGTTQVIARVGSSGAYKYDTCEVTVLPYEVILDEHELTLLIGETYQMGATFIPEIAANSIYWMSKSSSIAAINGNGLITAKAVGTTQIIARVGGNSSSYRYDTCMVTVVKDEPQPVYYTIRFLNYDGTELQNSQVKEGEMPVYTGATPTKPEDDNYTYTFSGWDPAVVAAAADADYTAQFTAMEKTVTPPQPVYYTVTFMDWDGTELLVETVEEGHDAQGPETNPTREGYIFTGWSKPITNITANLIVIAQYELEPQLVYYTIRFLNYDGTELQNSQVKEGEMPTYSSAMPVRPEDENYTYSFSGWSPAVVAATADADYTAQYTATEKIIIPDTTYYTTYYTIRFLNWDGAELQNSQVKEGEMPTYSSATPVRPEDEQYTYSFSGWSPAVVAAAADADYTAQFTATEKPQPKDYTPTGLIATQEGYIVWLDWDAVEGVSLYEWEFLNFDKSIGGNITSELYGGLNFEGTPAGEYLLVCRVRSLDASQAPISEWASVDFTLVIEDGQGIDNVQGDNVQSTKVQKILRDGQIFILRGDKVYTIQGQETIVP